MYNKKEKFIAKIWTNTKNIPLRNKKPKKSPTKNTKKRQKTKGKKLNSPPKNSELKNFSRLPKK